MSKYTYLLAILSMTCLGVLGIVGVEWVRPDQDNTELRVLVLGFLAPTVMSLLALLKAEETHLSVNSRLDQLLKTEKALSRSEGVAAGQDGIS